MNANRLMAQGKPVNKAAAVIIVLIWILVALAVGVAIYRWMKR
jgi:flagellar basal body-associated protein FliL